MKKRMTVLTLIFQAVAAVGLFLPWIYQEHYWKAGYIGFTLHHTTDINFFGGSAKGGGLLAVLTLMLMAASVAFLAFALTGKKTRLDRMGYLLPAASFAALTISMTLRLLDLVLNGGSSLDDCNGYWRFSLGWLMYLVLALALAAAVLAILIRMGRFLDTAPSGTGKPVGTAADLEELERLKGLLDSGVITQEDYDAKKKQLLKL